MAPRDPARFEVRDNVRCDIIQDGQNIEKPLVWLRGAVKTPPFRAAARIEAGFLLRRLQQGQLIGLPASRPMPSMGRGCHELRIADDDVQWRIVYAVEPDAIVVLDVFAKKTRATPDAVVNECRKRLASFRKVVGLRKGARHAR
jgi:phage-related protein